MEKKWKRRKAFPPKNNVRGLCFVNRKLHATFGICSREWTKRANFIWHVTDLLASATSVPGICGMDVVAPS